VTELKLRIVRNYTSIVKIQNVAIHLNWKLIKVLKI